jgi:polysaccharide export outer membrane protein
MFLVGMLFLGGCGASLPDNPPSALTAGNAEMDGSAQRERAASTDLASAVSTPLATTTTGSVTPTGSRDPATAQPGAREQAAVTGPAVYKIGPGDVLDVSVFKVPELSKTVTVADSGTVNLPLVGEVAAAGRTPQDVERDLTQKFGAKYLQSPQVTVAIKEYNSQRITVDGAVRRPGVFPYRSSVSLLQVIAMADGLDANSDSAVVVFRQTGGERRAARFDVSDIRSGAAPDPAIKPGDVVIVGSSAVKEAFNNVLKVLPLAGLFVGL